MVLPQSGAPLAKSKTSGARRVVPYLALGILYFLAARIGVALTVMPQGMAVIWPPNGVLLAFLILLRGRSWVSAAGVTLAAEVAADVPTFSVAEALMFGVINVAEATGARALLTRWRFDPRFPSASDFFKFLLAGPAIAAFGAALCGAAVYAVFRGGETGYLEFVRLWWFGDAIGLVIVTPLLLCFRMTSATPRTQPRVRVTDGLAALGAAAAIALLIVARNGMLMNLHVGPILLLPFLIFVAVRFGVSASAAAVAAAALLILVLTTVGSNPFGHATVAEAVVHAQEFVFVMSVMSLGLATILAELRAHQAGIETANAELQRSAVSLRQSNLELQRSEAEVAAFNAELGERVRARTLELEEALSQVKRLHGLLPICAWCKRVRDDSDYWHSVEDYISSRSEAQFSHSICPECTTKFSKEYNLQDDTP